MADVSSLAGFTIGITAARRREEFGAALARRGATVLYGPAIRIVPLENDDELRRATQACVDAPPDIVVATTGIGFRGWIEAADGWGLGEGLLDVLKRATLLARGPKVVGAMHAAGLFGEWSPESESSTEVLERLLTMDLQGRRVAIQLHGEPLPDMVDVLHEAGATVEQIQVYRWTLPVDTAPLVKLCQQVAAREMQALTFTSAPAAVSFLQIADELGLGDQVRDALHSEVLAVAVGPVTAAPLDRAGIPVVQPNRSRLGAMVREISVQVPARFARRVVAAGHTLELRGTGVLIDDRFVSPGPSGMALLRSLVEHPGQVHTRAELSAVLPGGSADDHAIEVAIGRLRTALGEPRIIQTVVKRGYRLAFDPEVASSGRY
ncbi:uroporphyrinogen-III synthase [Nakamurella flavida]|uniref:uroporphyrinogen-III synthase n=1 Tax=Nakamurella flavida TaxID=363630 RepID=UPI0027810F6E|nr:uroporphyrinogen-III synthase [Nakamurella flavida]MDP9776638.1 uroporphyrinogen-III synthase [Nakamurella flavida]